MSNLAVLAPTVDPETNETTFKVLIITVTDIYDDEATFISLKTKLDCHRIVLPIELSSQTVLNSSQNEGLFISTPYVPLHVWGYVCRYVCMSVCLSVCLFVCL